MATDCDRGFPVKAKTIDAFDFLVVVFLNVGYFFGKAKKRGSENGASEPEFYTLTQGFIQDHHDARSSWEKVRLRGLDMSAFKNEKGLELIAQALEVPYPSK